MKALQKDKKGKVKPEGFNLVEAFSCAFSGIADTVVERNFIIELVIGAIALILCAVLGVSAEQLVAVVICIGFVLSLECLNTALEAAVDLVTSEWHPLAKIAKDAAAGATLIAAVTSLVVGIVIFLPKLIQLLGW